MEIAGLAVVSREPALGIVQGKCSLLCQEPRTGQSVPLGERAHVHVVTFYILEMELTEPFGGS